jgi:hypothetical protein
MIGIVAPAAQAGIHFLDQDFHSDSVGQAPATGSMGPVITMPGAIGGFSSTGNPDGDVPPNAITEGTITVQNPNNQAVFSSVGSNDETGALFMDTGFNITSQQVTLGFDIDVMQAPALMTDANSQPMTLHLDSGDITAGILFGARLYSSTAGNWAVSVAVVPTSATGGVYALRNSDNSQLMPFGTYTNGQDNHITVVADYTAGTASAYINNTLGLSAYPLRNGGSPGQTGPLANATFNELFMYMNGQNTGDGNQVAVDNITGDFATVPEPATVAIWAVGCALVVGVRWRRRSH